MNLLAKKINDSLGVKVFNTSEMLYLELNKFTKKQIRDMAIDDLISNGKPSIRLRKISNEINGRKCTFVAGN